MSPRLTEIAHAAVGAVLHPGDWAIDATAGNGHDTAFLAGAVGLTGRVAAFDVQPEALAATRERLEKLGLAKQVSLILAGHETMPQHLPADWMGRVGAVLFNLGYLPGSDQRVITQPETTLTALATAADWLRPGGVLSVLVYPGHPGGAEEAASIRSWLIAPERHCSGWEFVFHGETGQTVRPWLVVGKKPG